MENDNQNPNMPKTPTSLNEQQTVPDTTPLSESPLQTPVAENEPPQGSSTVQDPPKKRNWVNIFFLVLIPIILVIFGMLGYQNYQLRQQLKKPLSTPPFPNTPVPSPTPTTDPTVGWEIYTIDSLETSFKLPPILAQLGNLKYTESLGVGIQKCWTFPEENSILIKAVNAGGSSCTTNKFSIGATATNYEAGRSAGFADYKGYFKENGKFYTTIGDNRKVEIPSELANEYTNPNGVRILRITGQSLEPETGATAGYPIPGTPGEGKLGAIINLDDKEFPGITIQMELIEGLNEELFDQILSTFEFTE